MKAKILSLNKGTPEKMEWQGRTVVSSMLRRPFNGPLIVHSGHIEENSFEEPQYHGQEHSVLYEFGMKSALEFTKLLGRSTYEPGETGENVTLDELDESQISIGDIFMFGEVKVQATNPRIPCGKVDIRMKSSEGKRAMQKSGRSGIYFRVLTPGKINFADSVERIETAKIPFLLSDVYYKMVNGIKFTKEEMELALENGAFPIKAQKRFRELLKEFS